MKWEETLCELCHSPMIASQLLQKNDDKAVFKTMFENGMILIVKCVSHKETAQRLEHEAQICAMIRKFDPSFPCPTPFFIGEKNGNVIYIQKYQNGVTLRQFHPNNKMKTDFCVQMVLLLKRMAVLPVLGNEAKVLFKESTKDYTEHIGNMKIQLNQVAPPVAYEMGLQWLQEHSMCIENTEQSVVVHNDLNSDNILIDIESDTVCLIDFEHALLGDPLKDVSKMVWHFQRDPKLGRIFRRQYYTAFPDVSEERLKWYVLYDVLQHFTQYHTLIKRKGWKQYFDEEEDMMKHICKGDALIW